MSIDVRWLGHSAFVLSAGSDQILVDPFLTQNPKAAATPDELEPTAITMDRWDAVSACDLVGADTHTHEK